MPPTLDESSSAPAGTISVREGAPLTLRCEAEGAPRPHVRWQRWRRGGAAPIEREQLAAAGSELALAGVARGQPDTYECVASNGVPPAASRLFSLELHFLPALKLRRVQHHFTDG